MLVEKGFRTQNPAIHAIPALRRLFGDEGGLHDMGMLGSSDAFEGDDVFAHGARQRQHAGAGGDVINEHRAGAALAESTAEAGIVQSEVIAQNVEKGTLGVHIGKKVGLAIYFQCGLHLSPLVLHFDRVDLRVFPDHVARADHHAFALFQSAEHFQTGRHNPAPPRFS